MQKKKNKIVQQRFLSGDTWLYYKIYLGPKTADKFLTEILNPICTALLEEKTISQWFFIRYADPEPHLRIRFSYEDPQTIHKITSRLYLPFKTWLDQDLIWKIQQDTYERELNRYGRTTIEIAEKLFFYDSKLVVDFLDLIEGVEGEEYRWLFGLRSIDNFLDSFLYSSKQKLFVIEELKKGFDMEFRMDGNLKRQMDDKFRFWRKKIDSFLKMKKENSEELEPIIQLLLEAKKNYLPFSKELINLENEGKLDVPLMQLIGSYLHMNIIRLFKSQNRLHELTCYNLIYRFYRSEIAKEKQQNAT